jgi:hypothetical protein
MLRVNKVISHISNTSLPEKILNIIIWDEMTANAGTLTNKNFDWTQLNCQYENVHLFVGFNPLDLNHNNAFRGGVAKTYQMTESNDIVPYQNMEKTFVVQLKTPHRSSASIKKFLNFIRLHDQDSTYKRK